MRRLLAILLLALVCGASSCDDGPVVPPPPPPPDRLVLVAGDDQTAEVSTLVADSLVVRVEGLGRGLADVLVTWQLQGEGWVGDLSAFETPTDSTGRAAVVWRLGPLAGGQDVVATVAGLPPVTFSALAVPGPAALIEVEPESVVLGAIGDTVRLDARAVDAFGNLVDEDPRVSWHTLYDGIVSVDAAGLLTALSDGQTPVEAKLGEALGGLLARVRLPVAALEVEPRRAIALTGDTVDLALDARTASGTPVWRDVADWTSDDPAVATVDSTGRVVTHGAGEATLTATLDGVSASATVKVHVGSGQRVPELAHVDSVVSALLEPDSLPGAAVAIVRDGRLVLARGYGYADPDALEPVRPASLFRVASVSKVLTAAAVMRLVEQDSVELDDRAFLLLDSLRAPSGTDADHRTDNITVLDLLQHSGGWDSDSFQPMFASREIAAALGIESPAGVRDIIRYMRGQELQFTPGRKYAYSNFGYAVLGRVIEEVSGKSYEEFVRQEVLQPSGITRARLARTREEHRAPGEVRYFYPGRSISVFPPHDPVDVPYGGFYLEAMDSHGGWVLSAVDMVRLMTALDGAASRPDLLSAQSLELMTAKPELRTWNGATSWYGRGFFVQNQSRGTSWWHDGSLAGTTAVVVRSFDERTVFAIVLNGSLLPGKALNPLWAAVLATSTWPGHDLFARYP